MNKLKLITLFLLLSTYAFGIQFLGVEIETGVAWSGYNDIKIPGKGGTEFSFSEELSTDLSTPSRLRFMFKIGEKSSLIFLYAPLELKASGHLNKDLFFFEETFPAGTELEGTYKFNSYRITYVYDWKFGPKYSVSIGFTAKVRDAAIKIESKDGILKSEKTNVGFVPILYFKYEYFFNENFGFLLEGDALAAPQGRAEDIFIGGTLRDLGYRTPIRLKLGYRILEGGADNEEVYNFTLINFIVLGITF